MTLTIAELAAKSRPLLLPLPPGDRVLVPLAQRPNELAPGHPQPPAALIHATRAALRRLGREHRRPPTKPRVAAADPGAILHLVEGGLRA